MSITEVEAKNQANAPNGEQSGEEIDKGADTSPDAETKNEVIKNLNNKESEMTDNKNEGQDQVDGLDESADAEDIKAAEKEKTEGTGLAPNVTLAPQNGDQPDLTLIANGVEVSHVSVPVDDDEGQWIDDLDGFKDIKDFIQINKAETGKELNDQGLLEVGTKLASEFNDKVSVKDAISSGTINKYRLMWGKVLDILQTALKQKDPKASWMKYYALHFTTNSLSSAEKYMKLAAIPNIIRWAFLGLERLEKIHTVIKDTDYMKVPDPIAAFFQDANIAIDFQEENLEKYRNVIDAAVTKKKIAIHFDKKNMPLPEDKRIENIVNGNLIHELISSGKKCDAGLINDLYLYTKGGADPNVLLEDLLESGGSTPPVDIKGKLTDIKTIEGFPKLISELKSKVAYLSKNTDLIQKITPQHMVDLQTQFDALKALVAAHHPAE